MVILNMPLTKSPAKSALLRIPCIAAVSHGLPNVDVIPLDKCLDEIVVSLWASIHITRQEVQSNHAVDVGSAQFDLHLASKATRWM